MKKCFLSFLFVFCFSFFYGQNIETIVQRSGGGECQDLVISPDGLLLAKVDNSLSSSEIEIWNVKTGHLLRVISTNPNADFNKRLEHVRFWKGSKLIITGTFSGTHQIYDVLTGKLVKDLPVVSYIKGVFAVYEKTGVLAFLDPIAFTQNEILLFDLYSNTVYDTLRIAVDYITALEFSKDGNEIAVGTKDGSFHIVEMKKVDDKRTIKHFSNVHKTPVEFLQWTNDNYLLSSDSSRFTFWDLTKGVMINGDTLELNCKIVTSPTEDCFYKATGFNISRLSPQRKEQKVLGIQPDYIQKFSFDEKNERIYILTDHFIKLWDLKNISQVANISTKGLFSISPFPLPKKASDESFQFVPAMRSYLVSLNDKILLKPIDTSYIEQSFAANGKEIKSLIVLPDNNPIATLKDKIITWKNGKAIEVRTESEQKILFNIAALNEVAVVKQKDSILYLYNISTGTSRKLALSREINCGAVSKDNKQFAVAGDNLYLVNAKTLQFKKMYDAAKEDFVNEYGGSRSVMHMYGNYRQLIFTNDGQKLFTRNQFGQVKVWNLSTFRVDSIININANYLQISPNGERLFIASRNELIWMNPYDYSIEARIVFLEKGDYIVSLSNNYYKASRNGAKAVAFRKGLQTSGFDQYDVIYNRPDIVTKKLGSPSIEMQQTLDKTLAKRQKKMGLSVTNNINTDIPAPEVIIKNYSSLPTITNKKSFEFSIDVRDKQNNLANCFAFINGVPYASKSGFNIPEMVNAKDVRELKITLKTLLDAGRNLIEVTCTNDKGIESARVSFEIFYNDTTLQKPVLYFIGIGAGRYKDTAYNLKYPSKDVADVAKVFREKKDMFREVNITLLTNEQVTKNGIKELRKMLDSTMVEDKVIIYWSGHGVLDKELNYFLATSNMDFLRPETTGMEYTELENLLDNIPARKRLIFIDACHSGEIDKDEISIVTIPGTTDGKLTTHNTKGNITLKKNSTSTSILLSELFADVRRNSGANVISAAGGAEYALEGDNWGYGVFTYCLLQALREKKADANNDGQILISELQSYLQEKVPQLTNGKQKPTSRTENLITDWRIW